MNEPDSRGTGPNADAHLRLTELLERPELRDARLRTSAEVAAARFVRSTSVQEELAASSKFVRADELVMTTGIGLDNDEEKLVEALRILSDANASCLAVAVGPHIRELSDATVTAADALHLPVIELPWDLRFSEIADLVVQSMLSRQYEVLRKSEQVHGLLTGIILSRGRLPEVCQAVSHLLNRDVTVVDRWGERRATTIDPTAASARPSDSTIDVPIATSTFELGSLCLGNPETPLTPLDRRTAQHAATAAALVMMSELAIAEAEARGEREFLAGLLSGLIRSAEDIARQAEALGADPRTAYAAVCLLFERSPEEQGYSDGPVEAVAETARWALERTLRFRRVNSIKTWHGPEALLLLPSSAIPVRQQASILIEDVTALVRRQHSGISVTAGIASEAAPLTGVTARVQEAVSACRLGRSLGRVGHLTEYEDLDAYPAVLEAVTGHDSARAFERLRDRFLGPVLAHEARTNMPLVDTLSVLFANNGNVSATARALGINRQSLLYRLAKIESLSRVSFASPSNRFALELALQVHRLKDVTRT